MRGLSENNLRKLFMKEVLIGREKQVEELREWAHSDRSEFIAIYGRRRVGKTFLVKHTFHNQFTFYFSGSHGLNKKEQLLNFSLALKDFGGRNSTGNDNISAVENWVIAFHELRKVVETSRHSKKIIFLDELPWIDTPKSGFIPALENFWNAWAAWRDDIKLIVCGSATSWMINKLIKNRGGLHNRLTHRMLVMPFQLKECEEYFKAYGFKYSRMQIAECYMTMGGIPYYFSLMNKGESLAQNIDRLFFAEEAPLKNEFEDLYRALYKNYQPHIKIIKALAEKGIGLTRQEILEKTKLTNNGDFSKMLEELELCGFIRSYLPFDKNLTAKRKSAKTGRDTLFQLIDFYSLFYLRFHNGFRLHDDRFWEGKSNSPLINTWRGITFEMLCLCNVDKIKDSLGIRDVSTNTCSWIGEVDEVKVQIDMLIDRADNTVNLCEMKFSNREFVINKNYADKLQEKIDIFIEGTSTHKTVLLTLITTKGIKDNAYSHIVQRQVTLDELF